MVTLMPVTDDDGGELRWRYRGVPGPAPFHYDKIDLEPGQAASIPQILRAIADELEGLVREQFGGIKGADKTTEVFHAEKKQDTLSDKFRKINLF